MQRVYFVKSVFLDVNNNFTGEMRKLLSYYMVHLYTDMSLCFLKIPNL